MEQAKVEEPQEIKIDPDERILDDNLNASFEKAPRDPFKDYVKTEKKTFKETIEPDLLRRSEQFDSIIAKHKENLSRLRIANKDQTMKFIEKAKIADSPSELKKRIDALKFPSSRIALRLLGNEDFSCDVSFSTAGTIYSNHPLFIAWSLHRLNSATTPDVIPTTNFTLETNASLGNNVVRTLADNILTNATINKTSLFMTTTSANIGLRRVRRFNNNKKIYISAFIDQNSFKPISLFKFKYDGYSYIVVSAGSLNKVVIVEAGAFELYFKKDTLEPFSKLWETGAGGYVFREGDDDSYQDDNIMPLLSYLGQTEEAKKAEDVKVSMKNTNEVSITFPNKSFFVTDIQLINEGELPARILSFNLKYDLKTYFISPKDIKPTPATNAIASSFSRLRMVPLYPFIQTETASFIPLWTKYNKTLIVYAPLLAIETALISLVKTNNQFMTDNQRNTMKSMRRIFNICTRIYKAAYTLKAIIDADNGLILKFKEICTPQISKLASDILDNISSSTNSVRSIGAAAATITSLDLNADEIIDASNVSVAANYYEAFSYLYDFSISAFGLSRIPTSASSISMLSAYITQLNKEAINKKQLADYSFQNHHKKFIAATKSYVQSSLTTYRGIIADMDILSEEKTTPEALAFSRSLRATLNRKLSNLKDAVTVLNSSNLTDAEKVKALKLIDLGVDKNIAKNLDFSQPQKDVNMSGIEDEDDEEDAETSASHFLKKKVKAPRSRKEGKEDMEEKDEKEEQKNVKKSKKVK